MNTASGWRRMSATPPRFASSFSSSASIAIRSLAGSRSSWDSSRSERSSCRRWIRSDIVRQFVRRPPSQRWLTYGMPTRGGLAGDRVLRLLLRADEQDRAVPLRDVAREIVGLVEQRLGLLEVDDVDPAALGEDETLHLRVPAARLMAEVNAGLQQLLHGDNGHVSPFRFGFEVHRRCLGGTSASRPPSASILRRVEGLGRSHGTRNRRRAAERPPGTRRGPGGAARSTSIRSPVNGCGNASREACRN